MKFLIRIKYLFLILISITGIANAAVTINLELGRLTNSESVTLPGGTLWALISEDSSTGNLPGGLLADSSLYANNNISTITSDFSGATIAEGNSIGGGVIVATGGISNLTPGDISLSFDFEISQFPSVATGDKLGVYWFPGRTEASNTLPTSSFDIGGFHRTDANSGSGGNYGLIVPPDEVPAVTMAFFDNDITSSSSGIALTEFEAIAVPEPSTLIFVGMSILLLLRRRR